MSSALFGHSWNIKSCLSLSLWHPHPPIRLWRFDILCTPWHGQVWIDSALVFHAMDVAAFLLLHQDPSGGSPDQLVLCFNRRSWDSKWESFQVWIYLLLKMEFYCLKEVIWICLVYRILFKKRIASLAGVAHWLSTSLWTDGLLVRSPVGAHAWVVGQVSNRGHMRGNHTLMFLFLSPTLLLCLKINKIF